VPWFADATRLPAEDAAGLDSRSYSLGANAATTVKIVVPRLPRIANFDDLDPLAAEPGVRLELIAPGRALPGDADIVLLPGSKATLADLAALREQGWDIDIQAHARRGGRVIGLCGGYQMLGRRIADPAGTEGPAGEAIGLGLLDVETVLDTNKVLREFRAQDTVSGTEVTGYEIHMGRTSGPDTGRPMLVLDGRRDGAVSADGRIAGCYIHGLFVADAFRRHLLQQFGIASDTAFEAGIETTLDRLADHLATSVDLDRLLDIARGR
jgi:adenosylcobyric acid synthase